MDEKAIRQELERVLKEEPNDYGRILELSTKLSGFDNDNIRFSVDAGVIDRLGSELVARQETAVSELVKNAYDADATKVNIKFENSDNVGGTLYIEDNGTGMTREQLINGFMRISSTSKIHNPLSDTYKRKRAGQKGIGRFAVQRLGEKLTITTQTADIRISDFKNFVFEQIEHLKTKEKEFKKDIQHFKALEQKERAMYEQLLLISELKRIYIARHLKR